MANQISFGHRLLALLSVLPQWDIIGCGGGENPLPRTKQAEDSQDLVKHTISLIEKLNPTYGFLIENPRGMLRKLPVVAHLPRRTVTYCTYGDTRMKPTDLWGSVCAPSRSTFEPYLCAVLMISFAGMV